MNTHELVLLSPYKFPAQYAMTLADEEMAAWLNGFTALWHPAILWQAKGAPRCEATYDHETPKAGFVYALPENPPAYLPDDWEARVKQAGALTFKTTADRTTTLANLKAALNAEGRAVFGWKEGFDLSADEVGPFFGLAWGHQLLASLCEAMEHENLLDQAAYWDDVQQAVALLAKLPYTPALRAAEPRRRRIMRRIRWMNMTRRAGSSGRWTLLARRCRKPRSLTLPARYRRRRFSRAIDRGGRQDAERARGALPRGDSFARCHIS